MDARRTIFFVSLLLAIQLAAACAMTDKEEDESLPDRKVRIVPFPVREMVFTNLSCVQEAESMELSGSLKNVSDAPLSNTRVQVKIFFAGDSPSEEFTLPVNPPSLQPGRWGDFSLSGNVQHPISHVELHALWTRFPPPNP